MDAFTPRDRALDYWFWKFHVGDLAFLVDLIVRRRTRLAEVRVSLWKDGVGRVIHDETSDWSTEPAEVRVGSTWLRAGASSGGADDVRWDLRWDAGSTVVTPLRGLVARIEPFDTTIHAWPLARFAGRVQVGAAQYDLQDVPGTFYHYWGRGLSARWIWLSATAFEEEPARRLEAIVAVRTRFLGGPRYPLPIGYLWSTDGTRSDMTISGVNGLVRARSVSGGIAIDSVGIGRPRHRAIASWGADRPNDIGEGIVQTMRGSVIIDGHRSVPGTVGLEVRAWPAVSAVATTLGARAVDGGG